MWLKTMRVSQSTLHITVSPMLGLITETWDLKPQQRCKQLQWLNYVISVTYADMAFWYVKGILTYFCSSFIHRPTVFIRTNLHPHTFSSHLHLIHDLHHNLSTCSSSCYFGQK